MNKTLKLRKTGNSIGTTFPKEVLHKLRVQEGDTLYVVETTRGLLLTPYDPAFANAMDIAEEVIARDKDALKALSTR